MLLSCNTYVMADIENGLIAYWSFDRCDYIDEISSLEGIGYGNLKCVDGIIGKAYYFDGEHSYIEVKGNDEINNLSQFTISLWINSDVSVNEYMDILSKDGECYNRQFLINQHFDRIRVHVGDNGWFLYYDGEKKIEENKWYHIVEIYDGNRLLLYINGQIDGPFELHQVAGGVNSSDEPIRIGGGAPIGCPPYWFHGIIDEIRIYNRAISLDEIQELFNEKDELEQCDEELKNIASLSDLHPKFYDGKIGGGSACVNESNFGPGWNPGEVITASFDKKYKIEKIGIYLGELGETGTGYVEARINGRYEKIADFEDFGVYYGRNTILLNGTIITDSIRFHMTSGGGDDENLCFSEIEIWGKDIRCESYNYPIEITSLSAPQSAWVDDSLPVEWTLTNISEDPFGQNGKDCIYLSKDDQFSSDDIQLVCKSIPETLDPGQSYNRKLQVKVPSVAEGDYWIFVVTYIDDKEIASAKDGPISIAARPLPDLTGSNLLAGTNTLRAGDTLTVEWQVTNQGEKETDAAWVDSIWLSPDGQIDEWWASDDVMVAKFENPMALQVGESYRQSVQVKIPANLAGDYYLIVKVNNNGDLTESSTENNIIVSQAPIHIEPVVAPTLLVVDLKVSPTEPWPGQAVTVSWALKNIGEIATGPISISHGIYLSKDSQLDGQDRRILSSAAPFTGNIAPGETTPRFSVTFESPWDIWGKYVLFVEPIVSDGINKVPAKSQIDLQPGMPADLVLQDFQVDGKVEAGRNIHLAWTVTNEANEPTHVSEWVDEVLISKDDSIETKEDNIVLARITHKGVLNYGESYSVEKDIFIPQDFETGTYHIFLIVDAENRIYEADYEDNNKLEETTEIVFLPPNLIVESAFIKQNGREVTSLRPGESVTLEWRVKNIGTGLAPSNNDWLDRVYLSPDEELGDDQLAVEQRISSALEPNDSSEASSTYTLPIGLAPGDYTLFFCANDSKKIIESTYQDNCLKKSVVIEAISPDLNVTDINITSHNLDQGIVDIQWFVENRGGATGNSAWIDKVYLSEDKQLDENDTFLGQFDHQGSLNTNQSYKGLLTGITIPNDMFGSGYILVVTDANSQVLESHEDNNFSFKQIPVPVEDELTCEEADLYIPSADLPSQGYSGQNLVINWKIVNQGVGSAANWHNAVYLSLDSYLDKDLDIYLGTHEIKSPLSPGEELEITDFDVHVPENLNNSFYVIIVADSSKRICETNEENNIFVSSTSIKIEPPPPSDLVVTQVQGPVSAYTGDQVTISWTVENQGDYAASGAWRDALYLSKDQVWDPQDIKVGEVRHVGEIAPNGTYQAELKTTLGGVEVGTYYFIVHTDIKNEVKESSQGEANNIAASSQAISIDNWPLILDEPQSKNISSGGIHYYKIENVPAGETLKIEANCTDENSVLEVFVANGYMPDEGHYDFIYEKPFWHKQRIVIPETEAGTYYVMVKASYVSSGSCSYNILAKIVGFEIYEVTPDHGGNTGFVTVTIKGSKLDEVEKIDLIDKNGFSFNEIEEDFTTIEKKSSSEMIVRLNLQFVPEGYYNLQFSTGNAEIIKPFEVYDGGGPVFQTQILGPDYMKADIEYTYIITLTNNGLRDAAYSELIISVPEDFESHIEYDNVTKEQFDGKNYYIISIAELPVNKRLEVPIRIKGFTAHQKGLINLWVYEIQQLRYSLNINGHVVEKKSITDEEFAKTTTEARTIVEPYFQPSSSRNHKIRVHSLTGWTVRAKTVYDRWGFLPRRVFVKIHLDHYIIEDKVTGKAISVLSGGSYFDKKNKKMYYKYEYEIDDVQTIIDKYKNMYPNDFKDIIGNNVYLSDNEAKRLMAYDNTTVDVTSEISHVAIAVNRMCAKMPHQCQEIKDTGDKIINRILKKYSDCHYATEFRMCERTSIHPINCSDRERFFNTTKGNVASDAMLGFTDKQIKSRRPYIFNNSPSQTNARNINAVDPVQSRSLEAVTSDDPNEKVSIAGFGEKHLITSQELIPYTIYFENKPTASAPAQKVVITDKLDPNLDWRTLQLGEINFSKTTIQVPDNRGFYVGTVDLENGLKAKVEAKLDIETGTFTWTLEAIDPETGEAPEDPMLGLLPPNDPETHVGEGYVTFYIKPKKSLPTGTKIVNQATIVFDNNEPIDTNTVFNTIDSGRPESTISASVSETTDTSFELTLSGQDDEGGSGIAKYQVYVAKDEGGFEFWNVLDADNTTVTFEAEPGHVYRFYSLAVDNVGNVEEIPGEPDAAVTVYSRAPYSPQPQPDAFDIDPSDLILSWHPAYGANSYDVFLWKDGEDRPDVPQFAGLTETSCNVTGMVEYGTTYRWQVVAHGSGGAFESEVWSFTTIDAVDTDQDGMADDWEMQYFNTLDRDGTGDFDHDGISDLDEYLAGTDPTSSNVPSIPQIVSPLNFEEIASLRPEFKVKNSLDPDGDNVFYEWQIFEDEAMTSIVAFGSVNATQDDANTTWTCLDELQENTKYFWRVRASDGHGYSQWAYGSFFVNVENDPPGQFSIEYPSNGAFVDTTRPVIRVKNAYDPDGDSVSYLFKIFGDEQLTELVITSGQNLVPEGVNGTTTWQVTQDLEEGATYYIEVVAIDEHGAERVSEKYSFVVNTFNSAPLAPEIVSPHDKEEVNKAEVRLKIIPGKDSDGDVLTYEFEIDTQKSFDSPEKVSSGLISDVFWDVSGLKENQWYYWRVRESDGQTYSPWTTGSFFVNLENDPPPAPSLKNPGDGAYVSDATPVLLVAPVEDPDIDAVSYKFMLFADENGNELLLEDTLNKPVWRVPQALRGNRSYYWTCQAVDEHGLASDPMPIATFFINIMGMSADHLDLSVMQEQVNVGQAFVFMLKVLDINGQLVEGFDGQVALRVSEGRITPSVLKDFINGQWRGEVIIDEIEEGTDVVITAETEDGAVGQKTIRVSCPIPAAPVLVYPDTNETVTLPLSFSWKVVSAVSGYEIQIATDKNMTDIIYDRDDITSAFIDIPVADITIMPGSSYYWRLRGISRCGLGLWTEVRRFDVPEVEPQLTITYPKGGENITSGKTITITWDYQGDVGETIKIRYNTGGRRWNTIATRVDVTADSYEWTVPSGISRCRIKIESEKDRTIYSRSDYFYMQ